MTDDFRVRFLIVDDEQSIRRLCMTIGASLGFVCAEADSAAFFVATALVVTLARSVDVGAANDAASPQRSRQQRPSSLQTMRTF